MLIDTHCHLNDAEAFPNPAEEVVFAAENGVGKLVVVGVQPSEWERTIELAQGDERLFCILGWHPNYTAGYEPGLLDTLEDLLKDPKVLALGEIGLDYHWSYSPVETQRRALGDQLDLAAKLDVPVVFHAREAYSDLLDFLEQRPVRPYLFHCFAGSADEARRVVGLGAYFGVDGPISYKKADELREVVRSLPRDRIVVETDAPYLSPTPFRGKPNNRPAYVRYVAEALATALDIPFEECAELTSRNAAAFFGSRLS